MATTLTEKLTGTIHPNHLTGFSIAATGAGLGLMQSGSPSIDAIGYGLITTGYILDGIDGKYARQTNRQTKEGARLDPLADKIKNFAVGGYILGKELVQGNIYLPLTMLANFTVDTISQKDRGNLLEQGKEGIRAILQPETCTPDTEKTSTIRANNYGKIKTGIQIGVGLTYLLHEYTNTHITQTNQTTQEGLSLLLGTALIGSAILGTKGILQRRKNKKDKRKTE